MPGTKNISISVKLSSGERKLVNFKKPQNEVDTLTPCVGYCFVWALGIPVPRSQTGYSPTLIFFNRQVGTIGITYVPMFNKIFSGFKKSYKLYRLSNQLSKRSNDNAFDGIDRDVVEEVIKMSSADPVNRHLLDQFSQNENTLRRLYKLLTLHGGGQIIKGYWISAQAIIDPVMLLYLLSHYYKGYLSVEDWDARNSSLYLVNKLIVYANTGQIKILRKEVSRADKLISQVALTPEELKILEERDTLVEKSRKWAIDNPL